MNGKLIFALMVAFIFCREGLAQSSIRLGVKGGVNLSTLSAPGDNGNGLADENSWLTTYHAGVIVDFRLNQLLSIRTGLDWQGKGTKYENALDKKGKLTPMFLELPVNIVIKKSKGETDFYAGLGPYIAYGVSGKNSYAPLTEDAPVISETINWTDEPPLVIQPGNSGYLKRLAFGANVIGGVEFSGKYAINLQYGHGLSSVRPADNKSQHRNLAVGIALFF